jgi:hypothetical protein
MVFGALRVLFAPPVRPGLNGMRSATNAQKGIRFYPSLGFFVLRLPLMAFSGGLITGEALKSARKEQKNFLQCVKH